MTSSKSSFHWNCHRSLFPADERVRRALVGGLGHGHGPTLRRRLARRWHRFALVGQHRGMDLTYPPEAEAFRTEIRSWLEEHLPDGWFDERLRDDRRRSGPRSTTHGRTALRGRLDLRHLAQGVRRQGSHAHAGRGARRGVRPGRRRPLRADFFGDTLVGPDDPAVGHRGAEEGVPAEDHAGRDAVVPGLQRARLRVRPRLAEDHRGARRRRVGHQRPEGVDHPGAVRRHVLPAGPHRPRRRQARGHLLPARADGPAGRRGAAHHPARRHRGVQRGVLRRRPLPAGQRGRRPEQRLGRRQHHARLRAGAVGHHRLPALRGGAAADDRRGARQRRRSTTP